MKRRTGSDERNNRKQQPEYMTCIPYEGFKETNPIVTSLVCFKEVRSLRECQRSVLAQSHTISLLNMSD